MATLPNKLNILYVSVREPHLRQGPTYSVPAQIAAQAQVDNVLWLNLVNSDTPAMQELFKQVSWKELPYYKDLSQGKISCLSQLPAPFNKPDLIVLEQFYTFGIHIAFLYKIIKSRIPFIIVPRGELTQGAQAQKKWKKKIANWLLFSRVARRAAAIQYLTNQEQATSGTKWNKKGFVIPNGVSLPPQTIKNYQPGTPVKLLYIGRLNIFHKGLDLLVQACALVKEKFEKSHVTLDIYGPDLEDNRERLLCMVQELGLTPWVRIHKELYKTDKIHALQQTDVFVMTSRFEGHPMGLIEALAYGLPCLATTGTNMREQIEKYNAGWTADNTVESIAAALEKMLKERDQFATKSTNARRLAEQYDWAEIAKQSHEIYGQIIRGEQ